MARVFLTLILLVIASGIGAYGQAPTVTPDRGYLFVDTPRIGFGVQGILRQTLEPGTAQVAKLRETLTEAGDKGYGVLLTARSSSSLAMLLKHEGAGPRTYRLIGTRGDTGFIKELNDAGAQGFRLVPGAAKIFNQSRERYKELWIAVLRQQSTGTRFTYAVVKGADEAAERGLADAAKRGAVLVAVLGTEPIGFSPKPFIVLEEPQAALISPSASGERHYRILSTVRTSTLEKEVNQAAAEGFRARPAGLMTLIMEREPGATAGSVDYRLLAMQRVSTANRELSAAGAEGFRIAVVPESGNEAVFVLERTPGNSDRFEYSTVTLKENTAGEVLGRAEADGYRVAVLFNDVVVLERSGR
jgi:hypothetical protein